MATTHTDRLVIDDLTEENIRQREYIAFLEDENASLRLEVKARMEVVSVALTQLHAPIQRQRERAQVRRQGRPDVCPKCGAMNVPNCAAQIALEQDGSYSCSVCGHDWRVA